MSRPRLRALTWIVPTALAVASLTYALLAYVRLPLAFSYVEGFHVNDAIRLAQGETIYGDPSHLPFVVTVYTPLYPAVVSALTRFGLTGLLTARLVTAASGILLALTIVLVGFRRTGTLAISVASLFVLAPVQASWLLVARPDFSAALFSMLGILAVGTSHAGVGLPLGVLFTSAAVLTKQSYFAAPAAIVLFLALRSWRQSLLFGTAFAFLLGAAAAWLSWMTGGWFFFHTVTANMNSFSWHTTFILWGRFISTHLPELLLATPAVAAVARAPHRSLLALYALLACLVALSAGKVGSDSNYFIEPLAAVAALAAAEFPVAWFDTKSGFRSAALLAAGLAVVALGSVRTAEWYLSWREVPAEAAVFQGMCRNLASHPGPAISDDAVLLGCAHKAVMFQPFVMTQLAKAGHWDQTPLVDALEHGEIATVIAQTRPEGLFRDRYTPAMREILSTRYRPVASYKMSVNLTDLDLTLFAHSSSITAR